MSNKHLNGFALQYELYYDVEAHSSHLSAVNISFKLEIKTNKTCHRRDTLVGTLNQR